MQAFITGSRCYGTPTDDSDIDVVIFVDPTTAEQIWALSEGPDEKTEGDAYSCRFGNLNLIVTTTIEKYNMWRVGTNALFADKPVTREKAVELFDYLGVNND